MDRTAAASSSSGIQCQLHPLLLLNISDHWTRMKAINNGIPTRVMGCLLGEQKGRVVALHNSFEIKYQSGETAMEEDESGECSAPVIDESFLMQKMEQYKQVFPKQEVVGWYSTGTGKPDSDMKIHNEIAAINENPLYLVFNPEVKKDAKDLPVEIYESEVHVLDGVPSHVFVLSSYTVETVEAERIAVDQVAKILPAGQPSSTNQLAAHLTGLHSAIKMLSIRIDVLLKFVRDMKKGDIPRDNYLMRQIARIAKCLPTAEGDGFDERFLWEYNDTMLMTYLAMITNSTHGVHELVEKVNMMYDRHSRGFRRGL